MTVAMTAPPTLDPVLPNAGLRITYERRLDVLVDAMTSATLRAVTAMYAPTVIMDASPAATLRADMRRLARRWLKRFEEIAPETAAWFAASSAKHVDSAFAASLRKAGFTVRLKRTLAQINAQQSIVAQNVALIRSIPQEYMLQVEGSVMRAVGVGRDLHALTQEIQAHNGVTYRRARLIAQDQVNKATAMLDRTRQIEAGITEAIWVHSAAGNEPRPDHVAYSGKPYNVVKGALISDKRIWPGTEIHCRCFSRPVIPGWVGPM